MTRIVQLLYREMRALWPVFLFFLIGFMLLAFLIKTALADFSIEITVLSNTIVGALIAAKAALVMDEIPLARKLEHNRRIVAVAVKTFLYGLATLMMGYLERFLEAYHRVHSSSGAFQYLIDHADHHRIVVWTLGISTIFALYFSMFEISQKMGEGALWRLFFDAPTITKGPQLSRGFSTAKRQD